MIQKPYPGQHILLFRGDIINFELSFESDVKGKAFLRTNIGNASIQRSEIIASVKKTGQRNGQDWHDIRMERTGNKNFSIAIALLGEGHFEAKCFFINDESPDEPIWVQGPNVHINVEPSTYCCANSIYCAFVRQFGINKNYQFSKPIPKLEADEIAELDKSGYIVIPPSGTFRDLKKCLDHIIDDLNCRIIHLLPINPTPTVYGRMGRYGSPYASLDFTAIDPALCEFDRKATPLEQFLELVDAIHRKKAKIFIDIAINHTGWAAKIHETHPEWLVREQDNTIHSPGAWGVIWGDLTELNHSCVELWEYLADVFLTWCSRGVDGFRCDAGYMIPERAWEFIIAKVRDQYPATIFLLEGLGGDPAVTLRLLDNANMNWAYSELFQNYSKEQIEGYLAYAHKVSLEDGIMVHYAETHDNNRLAAVSETYARMRTALSALASNNGAFGFTNGVEWFAKEKIDVHESNALAWGNPINQVKHISRLNSILISHPAFYNGSKIKIIPSGHHEIVSFIREDASGKNHLLIIINLNCSSFSEASIDNDKIPFTKTALIDLISEENIIPIPAKSKQNIKLAPGQALCLSDKIQDLKKIIETEEKEIIKPDKIALQNAAAMALDIICWKNNSKIIFEKNTDKLAKKILSDPYQFCFELFQNSYCPIIEWRWPEDINREVIIPPNHIIMIKAKHNFRVRIAENNRILIQRESLLSESNWHFALLPPLEENVSITKRQIKITVYADEKSKRETGHLIFLPECKSTPLIKTEFSREEIINSNLLLLSVNYRGGMLRQPLKWGELKSRYDCILAANINTEFPEDRHIMWTRCRICTDYHGRKEWFSAFKIENFSLGADSNSGIWNFQIPLGNGLFAKFAVALRMIKDKNQVVMHVRRIPNSNSERNILDDKIPLRLIIRPDIEDRNYHCETKAYLGPESQWSQSVSTSLKSFIFAPSQDRKLLMWATKGTFKKADEWSYAIFRQNEADRGLDPYSDLYSPGYFDATFTADEEEIITAAVVSPLEPMKDKIHPEEVLFPRPAKKFRLDYSLENAMDKFIVKRENWKTVIAGYPWFLDWGRDTLITARGMIAASKFSEVEKIILLFAKYAEKGTLPNMIQGGNASNRDTSDAPLWLFTLTKDFCWAKKSNNILSAKIANNTTLLDKLIEIAEYYIKGTPNGIKMDHSSALIFSPSHFTWMDTNFPACTPREGYPIEIQALWHTALIFLYENTGQKKWLELAEKVSESTLKLYPLSDPLSLEFKWLSDCLHCTTDTPAIKAIPDDHLRPNQLLAITLGLITDNELKKGIIRACSELIVPGAIRSLADREVKYELPISNSSGNLLNNPKKPYWGTYSGPEDISRKPAYHNGTAWTWLFPSYAEAMFLTYGEDARSAAASILSSSLELMENGTIANIPEILDGNYPHCQKGCDAQAWGVSELYRVWKLLNP